MLQLHVTAFINGPPRWHSGKESTCQCRRHRRCGSHPWVGKIPWSRKWQATPVFLPGKFYAEEPGGQRSMGSQRVGHEHIHTRTPWPSLFWVLKLLYSSSQRVKGACDFFHLVGSETVGSCLRLIRHVDLIFPSNSVNSSLN